MAKNRPNAAILGYAVTSEDVKGCNKTAPDTICEVDFDTCPCFLFATRTDNIVPIAIERVTARYIDNLKFCLCDCQTALGKYFSREIDKRKREWERTLRDNPEYRQTIERNTERLDEIRSETGNILIVQHVVADSADSTLDRCEASPDGAIAIQ